MIKFFRRIRQKLLNEGNLKRYLIYAIGEILLVMIGILLALQVNNWNESNRLAASEIDYLKEIRNDLVQDTLSISVVIRHFKERLSNLIDQDSTIQPLYNDVIGTLPSAERKIDFKYYLRTERPFRPKPGTYNSLISEGKSSLIRNRQLFDRMQALYEDEYQSLERISNAVFERSLELGKKYARTAKYEDFGSPIKIRNEEILADLNNSYGIHALYTLRSVVVKRVMFDLIITLDNELEFLE